MKASRTESNQHLKHIRDLPICSWASEANGLGLALTLSGHVGTSPGFLCGMLSLSHKIWWYYPQNTKKTLKYQCSWVQDHIQPYSQYPSPLQQRWLFWLCVISEDAGTIRNHFLWCHTTNIHVLPAVHLPQSTVTTRLVICQEINQFLPESKP